MLNTVGWSWMILVGVGCCWIMLNVGWCWTLDGVG